MSRRSLPIRSCGFPLISALTTAWECLDLVAVHRQLRGLGARARVGLVPGLILRRLARAMLALVVGDLSVADEHISERADIGSTLGEPDVEGVVRTLTAYRAIRAGVAEAIRAEAMVFDAYGTEEGISSTWPKPRRSRRCGRARPRGRSRLPGGSWWCGPGDARRRVPPTVSCVVEVTAALGLEDLTREGAAALEPYGGRRVLNAGAVMFMGLSTTTCTGHPCAG